MAELPSGTVTFLFTDLEVSTRLWEEHPEDMKVALACHDGIVRSAIESHRGHVVKARGDGFHGVFHTAHDAIDAALDAQTALSAQVWPETGALRVRMGIHTGETQERDGDYFGPAVNRAARVMAVAHGGQIVCSRATVEVAGAQVPVRSLGEHRLRDLGAPQELFQIGDGSFPPLQSLDVVPTNLPLVMTELIGRSDDVARIAKLLEHERLVTLTGVGGVGKTRLALAVAGASVGAFPDGVWCVELAPLNSSDEVVSAAVSAMGATATDRTGLAGYLSGRRVLIVLDNCEHVLADAASLAEAILLAGSDTVILATSREPLGIDGETVRGVRSLSVPDTDADDSVVATAPAVRLFVERASAATDTFELSDANVVSVVDICAQLDGIPLAIELAASRVRAMPPAEIARRLGERFRLLAGGRGAHERHRTLQATVSWSHDLLSDTERRVFRRLAVFPSSFDLDAAEEVAGDPETYVIDALMRLVEQSLVQHDATTGRYRLLETLRQYASDRLLDNGETDVTLDRHTAFYAALAARNASLGAFPSSTTIGRIEAEMDNLKTAADGLARAERWNELLQLGRHLFAYGFLVSPREVAKWYFDALERDPMLDAQDRIDALGEFSLLASSDGSESDNRYANASVASADATGLPQSPWPLFVHYVRAQVIIDAVAAGAAAKTMLEIARARDDDLALITALGLVGSVHGWHGDDAGVAEFASEGLRRTRLIPNPFAVAVLVATVAGGYLVSRPEPDCAAGLAFLEANPVDPDVGTLVAAVYLHLEWGIAFVGTGRSERAVSHLTRALRIADRQYSRAQKECALALAVALGEAGHLALAAQLHAYADLHFAHLPSTGGAHVWLESRFIAIEQSLDPIERAEALERGRRFDRRGFMRLLADAETRVSA